MIKPIPKRQCEVCQRRYDVGGIFCSVYCARTYRRETGVIIYSIFLVGLIVIYGLLCYHIATGAL